MRPHTVFTPELVVREDAASRALRRIGEFANAAIETQRDLDTVIRQGLSPNFITLLVDQQGYTRQELKWVIAPRTLNHREDRGEKLTLDESGKLIRAARLTLMAEEVFGDTAKAERWMHKPRSALGGISAMEAMQTETGGQMVEELLVQMESGYFA